MNINYDKWKNRYAEEVRNSKLYYYVYKKDNKPVIASSYVVEDAEDGIILYDLASHKIVDFDIDGGEYYKILIEKGIINDLGDDFYNLNTDKFLDYIYQSNHKLVKKIKKNVD